MGVFKKYPEVEHLHKVSEIFLEPEVVVTEKIHGTNVRFGWVEERFRVGGRNEEFDFIASKDDAGMGFLGWLRGTTIPQKVKDIAVSQSEEIIFYGEWHGPRIQKGIRYAEAKQIRLFAVRLNENFIGWDSVINFSQMINVNTVPVLYRGIPSKEIFDGLRVKPSVVAYENGIGAEDNFMEGIVITPRFMRQRNAIEDKWIIAKYKNPRWEERQSLREGKEVPVTPVDAKEFVDEFFTEERLEHVLTNLKEKGIDVTASTAIGLIIKGMYDDVVKEAQNEFEQFSPEAKKSIGQLHARKTKALLHFYLEQG